MRRQRSSRLTRNTERQSKRQALFFALGTIIVIILLIQFGPLIINTFGNIVYTLRGADSPDNNQIVGSELLQAPILQGVPEATQSALVSFSGIAPSDEGLIEIYLNDKLEEEVTLDSTRFDVELDIRRGENTLKARYSFNDKTSAYTEEYVINYTTAKPELEIAFPSDNATFTRADKSITVSGKTDPENTVTINSFRAIVDSDGTFNYLLQLNDGENQISVIATNPAGVTTQSNLKVTYQP